MNKITAMMSSNSTPHEYAINIKPIIITVTTFVHNLQDDSQKLEIQRGTILRILPNIKEINQFDKNRKNISMNSSIIVEVKDYFHNNNPIWNNLYQCTDMNHLKKIDSNLFPFLIAIENQEERFQFAMNDERMKACLEMKIDDIILVWGEQFQLEVFIDCIIKYIGAIPKHGPGKYFALEILNLPKGRYSPQADEILEYAKIYTKCDAHLSLILSANWIYKDPEEKFKSKYSLRGYFSGPINCVKSLFGFSSSETQKSNSFSQNSLKRSSFRKSKTSYPERKKDIKNKKEDNRFNVLEDNNSIKTEIEILQTLVMDNQKNYNKSTGQNISVSSTTSSSSSATTAYKRNKSTNTNFSETKPTISNQTKSSSMIQTKSTTNFNQNSVESKDKSIQSDEDLIKLDDNKEYAKKIESYEMFLEQKHSNNNNNNNNNNQPVSILKQPKIGNITSNNLIGLNNSFNSKKKLSNIPQTCKPNTIMSLEDRDIVVIDKADIKESTKNENSIIVLDNPQKEVDLAELLGSSWPTNAGDAGMVLNSTTTNNDSNISMANNKNSFGVQSTTVSGISGGVGGGIHLHSSSSNSSSVSSYSNRNKSPNLLTHIGNRNSLDRKVKENATKMQQQQQRNDASNFMGTAAGNVDSLTRRNKKSKNAESVYDNTNSSSLSKKQHTLLTETSSSLDDEQLQQIEPSPLNEIPGFPEMGVGSMVEVSTDVCENLYGVIRWIGYPIGGAVVMVGVELEDDHGIEPLNLTNGSYGGKRLFKSPDKRAIFVKPRQCSIDRRFTDFEIPSQQFSNNASGTTNHNSAGNSTGNQNNIAKSVIDTNMFGQVECPPVTGSVAPMKMFNLVALEEICGKFKGIQGHHNSCYLDATLFAMFAFTSVFDSLLFRPPEKEDIKHYEEVQKVLREDIVNPLRKNVFVRADRVMKLRHLLEELSSVRGLTCEEKDPEEFLNSLLAQIMRADPFLKLSSGQDTFFYQLFVEKDERLSFPSVQQLFEQSFLASDIKLKEVPSCLIIQMPRFGKNFKMYPRILPSQVLDVTDIIEDSPRQCTVCGKLAEFECRECFGVMQSGAGLESTGFCQKCLETAHSHAKRTNHKPKKISVPEDFKIMAESIDVPRLFMELFAVVCIETSHYVAFVKAGSGSDAPWCFFDSMADRKGEKNGYNIPELVTVPDLPQWLSEEGARSIHEAASNDKMLPEHAKRLLCDAYMCMYQSTDVMMYR